MSDQSDFSLNDFFGPNPNRPNHPDFWKLSQLVTALDAAMTEGVERGEDIDDIVAERAAKVGDSYSLAYVATQRAMRIHGAHTVGDVRAKHAEILRSSMMYLEGIIIGAQFAREPGA